MENTNTITISLEDYNEYIILKERLRLVEKKVNSENYTSVDDVLDILDIERIEIKKED